MDNQPDTNLTDRDRNNEHTGSRVGGDQNIVYGNVTGGVVGRGTVNATNIAGGDVNNGAREAAMPREFADLVSELEQLIVEARDAGEMPKPVAEKALSNLSEAVAIIKKEEKPPKNEIMRRLQYVADVIDAIVDMVTEAGGAAGILLKALPVINLLIKTAGRIF
ncbi:MAG TPA: hypothetical protein PK801_03065 [Aggregatilineales bacterium]|nr:hypothetical protein [Chloroflexota bacterium]HOA22632.1 hypothetical protein [Aggregatilineales bacterium]HPV08244.1 hypothetical protein [Aggregatilineales bacterium]HQA67275.1 hypothetical protein [Aggregatilineales bacterium]HQE18437.1 hypothetical protein [Aggregatilineales bacterium]